MIEKFSASRAAKHIQCHASANLELAIPGWEPPPPSPPGARGAGTAVHEVVQDLLAIQTETASGITRFNASDMLAMGQMLVYIGEVWKLRRFKYLSEETVVAEWLDTKPKTTADLVFYVKNELHIIDMKWGKIPVEVFENEQLLFYAASYAHLAPQADKVTVHIVQPRADNMESWEITPERLAQFMTDARAADAAIQAGDTTFGVGDHCLFCPAYPHARTAKGTPLCPAAMDMLYPPGPGPNEDDMLNDDE